MDLLQLQYFRTIARTENLTKAAQLLFVTQPNLSASITRLEEDLGVSLFNRRKGKIVLTSTGRIFLDHVDRILDDLETGIGQVRAEAHAAQNYIRIAGNFTDLFSDLFLRYYFENTDVFFKQINCPNEEVYQKVLSEEVDIGFVFGAPRSSDLEYLIIDSCERVVILHQDHPLTGQKLLSLSQLANEKMICNRSRDDGEFLADLAAGKAFYPSIRFEINDSQFEISLLLNQQGISISPITNYVKIMHDDPALPLKFVRFANPLPMVQIGMIRRKSCRLSDTTFQFYRHVDEFFKEENLKTKRFLNSCS